MDLWAGIAEEVMDRQVEIVKVKAHRTEEQMQQDKQHDPLSEQHYIGNNKADELATKAVNQFPNQCAKEYLQTIQTNYTLQALLIRIIHDKTEREIRKEQEDEQKNYAELTQNEVHHTSKPTARLNIKTNLCVTQGCKCNSIHPGGASTLPGNNQRIHITKEMSNLIKQGIEQIYCRQFPEVDKKIMDVMAYIYIYISTNSQSNRNQQYITEDDNAPKRKRCARDVIP